MAEDKEKKTETTEEEAPPKKKGKLLWIAIAVVVLAAAGGGGFWFMSGGADPAGAPVATAEPAEPAAEPAGLVPMDTFLVNLRDEGGERYMKLTLRLTISPETAAEKVDTDELMLARMRDRILTVLTAKTYAELGNPLGKENLRHEIRAQINPLVAPGQVQDVLFSEFVVQ